ncbi:hypothetical protein [Burkholderia sp. PU8-34]
MSIFNFRWVTKVAMPSIVALWASHANAAGQAAVAHMPKGMSVMVIDESVTCDGGPTGIVLDSSGHKVDQTCNVHYTTDGVRLIFAGYGKPIFFPKSQFTVIDAP